MAGPIALVVLLVATLAAFGGIYSWALPGILAGALVLTGVARRVEPSFVGAGQTALDWGILALVGSIAIQLLPLPLLLRSTLSPHLSEVEATLLPHIVVRDTTFAALSLNPGATWQALILVVATALTYRGARIIFTRGGVRTVCRALVAIGALAAVGALIQRALTPTLIYGFWKPVDIGALPFGPVVNRNHFAGWLVMASAVAAGYLLAQLRTRISDTRFAQAFQHAVITLAQSRVAWTAIAWVAITITVVVSQSRSGVLALAIACATFARASRRSWLVIVAGGTVVVAVGLLLVLLGQTSATRLAERLTTTLDASEVSRVVIWRESLPIVADFWPTGIGAGAYGRAMLTYQQTRGYAPHLAADRHFNHAHNHYLQLMSEGGLLVTVPFAVVVVLFMRLAAQQLARDKTEMRMVRVGAVAGLAGIAAQSIWELPLTMPAAALLAATLAALATYERASASHRSDDVIVRNKTRRAGGCASSSRMKG